MSSGKRRDHRADAPGDGPISATRAGKNIALWRGRVEGDEVMSDVPPFLWQSALILLLAYFVGAWIGCMLRRLLTRPRKR